MEPGQAKEILDKLLHDLYEVPILAVYDNIAVIIQDNIELTMNIANDDAVRYVRFKGKVYFSANLPDYKDRQSVIYDTHISNRNMILHEATTIQLILEIDERTELEQEQKSCAYYLRTLLNECRTLYDVRALLPGAIWSLLNIKLAGISTPLSFTNTEVDRLKETYAKDSDTVKERLFLNLLLKRV